MVSDAAGRHDPICRESAQSSIRIFIRSNFETAEWLALWDELKGVFEFWIEQGVRIFRVDNPHTKPFPFWEWVIGEIKAQYPEVIFLAEAFTRPHVMYRLAKLGFSQSYTYFAWRNTKQELTEYFTELTQTEVREYFRPNLWPNTPDILPGVLAGRRAPRVHDPLGFGGDAGGELRNLRSGVRIVREPALPPGSEEYLNSEKYELKHRDLDAAWSLKELIARINRIRKENPALQSDHNLRFHETDNPLLLCYSKATDDSPTSSLSIVNLDPFHTQTGWVDLDLSSLGLDASTHFRPTIARRRPLSLAGRRGTMWN